MHQNVRRKLLSFFKFQALRALVESESQLGVTIRGTPAISHGSTLSTGDFFLYLSKKTFFLFFELAYKADTNRTIFNTIRHCKANYLFLSHFGILSMRFTDLWIFLEGALFWLQFNVSSFQACAFNPPVLLKFNGVDPSNKEITLGPITKDEEKDNWY